MLSDAEIEKQRRASAPAPTFRPPSYAWGAMGMRESTEAPTLFYKMHEIERFIRELQAEIVSKGDILRRIVRTHMHNGHCTWCDSDVHEKDCFVAAAIAETSRRDSGTDR